MKYINRANEMDEHGEYCSKCQNGPLTEADLFKEWECPKCNHPLVEAEDLIHGAELEKERGTLDQSLSDLFTTAPAIGSAKNP